MEAIARQLKEVQVEDVRINEPLSRHTTWKVGGPADLLVYPRSKEELQRAMAVIYQSGIPWRVIGRGSNLLVRDGGIRGAVIKTGKGIDDFRVEGTRVIAGGGYSMIRLASMVAKYALTGLEFGGGIPGTVGGAVFMNAGAHGSEVSRVLESAEVLLETGEWIVLSNDELEFSYRTSILQSKLRGIVTEATFRLEEGDRRTIASSLAQFKDRRRQTQPLQYPCAGSVFRNPPGDHSGRLIEAAGLKGYRVGDAEVSTQHANFIINRGQATAEDVLTLIHHIIRTVEDRFGVSLEPEVQVVGEG
ncbi:UDP-N-acetylenolpyruvoylglucosamine reductase [Marinithermofilum abyssi]|uniref:UDP-N-acetylenolpyruvoylglucosamine reductase n=1 Tax=Marinithermofilum abyssi TaxID=1571185 RepID=A0A8J2VHH4_9BACL|nr:UDP-N-acetylmuramate dehydrogenase [Marinithermofilum abyssi]GGE22506.1 UDP-N-acetylenolpyruvoylglucosamine reductase [Marinithermofilum abyssi]